MPTSATTSRPINSTTVRSSRWFRGAMAALSTAAPPVATAVAERMFLRPRARPLRPEEREWAAEAREVVVESPVGPLRTWSWEGGGRVVLLAHGWSGRGPQMGALGRALARRGHTGVAWDMPGHGERSRPTTLVEMARAMDTVGRAFGDMGGVITHSFGAATTLAAHARHGVRMPRLAAIAPAALLHRVLDQFADMTGFSADVVTRVRDRLSRRFHFEWDEFEAATVAPALDCPVLIVHDEEDARVPLADGAALHGLLRRAELVTTAGLGHSGIVRDAGVVERVAAFMAEADASVVR